MKKKTLKTVVITIILILVIFFIFKYIKTPDVVLDPVNLADPFLGPENAAIVVVEYSEFQCPYCAAAFGTHDVLVQRFKSQMPSWEPSVPGLEQLAREGKIKFVFKHFPLAGHEYAQKAAEAAEAANAQGKFWEYHDALFEKGGAFDDDTLIEIAEELDLDVSRFKAELKGDVYARSVRDDMREGQRLGVGGTPAFLINGQLIEGAQPFQVFEEAIASLEE
ncbi:thioredoxin domain-containing protein [Candidatus Woesearchaeota archaeon]|jgi:protein-disulfide isomerase|nr:thioredoxin domain-containing protein [Candidatus Woesearchaeota archaeon]MBT3304814.1 thioredoxin domain-containing protein [Candidatus Woesearchaeota archaeon]MBT4367850.1 thioredoxin domain-containing protein [Candidatus Woesearchaeota archaeon]MBT4712338.1 thioredoxin domain-containing protein [Candidatus Woesearchaeota archaeon]MBT6639250.1 thioredoxin domain-containing protein [Candidatus Woesearchaeota archaeon]